MEIDGNNYDIGECMVIRMSRTSHGASTCISYRFEEKPTGKVFVFCSDHEDVFGVPVNFRQHLADADLLIADAQYNHEKYHRHTAGFGHGTPYGVVKQGIICNVRRIGITHHDPGSTDTFLENTILAEAREAFEIIKTDKTVTGYFSTENIRLTDGDVFLCNDFAEYEV